MPTWWRPPGGRTRRPGERYKVPGELALVTPAERLRLTEFVGLRVPYLLLIGLLLWLVGYLLLAPEFRVSAIQVAGARLVDPGAVAPASGIFGASVFLVRTSAARASVLAANPPIESASIAFGWPNRPTITIVERRAFAVWRSANRDLLVSQDGIVLGMAPPGGAATSLADDEQPRLTIEDLDAQPVEQGGSVDRDVLAEASYLAAALRQTSLDVRSLEYSREYGVIAPGAQGTRVAFGADRNPAGKVAILRALLEQAAIRHVALQFVDLRVEDRPFYR